MLVNGKAIVLAGLSILTRVTSSANASFVGIPSDFVPLLKRCQQLSSLSLSLPSLTGQVRLG